MPRKKKEEIIKEKNNKIAWIITSILCIVFLIFAVFKLGLVGKVLNNVLSFLLGDYYIVPLLTIIGFGIYYIFFSKKYHFSKKLIFALVFINLIALILPSLIHENVLSFDLYGLFIKESIKHIFVNSTNHIFQGGIFGTFLYVCFIRLFSEIGTIILLCAFGLISLILLIPNYVYSDVANAVKQANKDHKIEKAKKKEEKKQEELKKQELEAKRKAEQAERMANEYEEVDEDDEQVEPENTIQDGIINPNSDYFITLDTNEVNKEEGVKSDEEITKEEVTVSKVKKRSSTYHLPPISLLDNVKTSGSNVNKTSAVVKGEKVIEILKNFGIDAVLVNTHIGPSVTKFEIKPDSSVKVSKIQNISDNIKMELAAKDIRIEAPIPGRSAVGIEIPNVEPVPVRMVQLLKTIPSDKKDAKLLFALGKDLMGKGVYCDLQKMPHLLIAGATGSGKSVCINTIITSYLMHSNPDELKLVLIDPKKVEFTGYKDIPHLLWPVITDAQMANNMLKKAVVIMEDRYDKFADAGVRDIKSFNEFVDMHNANLKEGESPMNRLPYIVIIIDELADLMAVAGKDVEMSITRLTQLARASGIHMIVATQRPSTDVITGLIKSNIPSRISFAVASSIDSRTIIDSVGAERLLGNGDMLYCPQGENAPIRLQGCFVSDNEVKKVADYCRNEASPEYEDSYFEFLNNMNGTIMGNAASVKQEGNDGLYDEVVEYVKEAQKASTSLLQRRFGIGYNRAARLIDTLEDRGIIGPANGSKPREVYIKKEDDE